MLRSWFRSHWNALKQRCSLPSSSGKRNISPQVECLEDRSLPAVNLTISNPEPVQEDNGTVTFTVSREGELDRAVTVDFSTVNGTAKAGVDYEALSGTITFDPGQTEGTITVELLDNDILDGIRAFGIDLSNPQVNGSEIEIDPNQSIGQAFGVILDDEIPRFRGELRDQDVEVDNPPPIDLPINLQSELAEGTELHLHILLTFTNPDGSALGQGVEVLLVFTSEAPLGKLQFNLPDELVLEAESEINVSIQAQEVILLQDGEPIQFYQTFSLFDPFVYFPRFEIPGDFKVCDPSISCRAIPPPPSPPPNPNNGDEQIGSLRLPSDVIVELAKQAVLHVFIKAGIAAPSSNGIPGLPEQGPGIRFDILPPQAPTPGLPSANGSGAGGSGAFPPRPGQSAIPGRVIAAPLSNGSPPSQPGSGAVPAVGGPQSALTLLQNAASPTNGPGIRIALEGSGRVLITSQTLPQGTAGPMAPPATTSNGVTGSAVADSSGPGTTTVDAIIDRVTRIIDEMSHGSRPVDEVLEEIQNLLWPSEDDQEKHQSSWLTPEQIDILFAQEMETSEEPSDSESEENVLAFWIQDSETEANENSESKESSPADSSEPKPNGTDSQSETNRSKA